MYKTAAAATFLALMMAGGPALAQTANGASAAAPVDPTIVVKGERVRKTAQWFKAESQNFIVYSDAKRSDVATLLGKMERFRYVLRSYLRQDTQSDDDAPKLEIYYLSHEQDLDIADPAGPQYSIGLYKSCEDATQAYGVFMYYTPDSKLPLEKQPDNEGLNYMFEAYARHYLYQNSFEKQPTWFIDGFAHYFSTARFDGNEAIVGMAPAAMSRYLNLIGNQLKYSLDYKDILQQKETNGTNYIGVAGVKNEFQVRSWVLTHYVLSSKENRQKFAAYVADVGKGTDPLKAFQAAFGISAGQVDNVLWTYMRTNLQALKLNFKALPEADITYESLPDSADKLLMWRSALESCPSAQYGQSLLGKLRATAPQFPNSDLAQLTLSRAEAEWGNPSAALPYLTQTTAQSPDNFEAQYLLGRAQLAVAQKSGGEARTSALTAAGKAFAKASVVQPKSASTAYYFYRTQVLNQDKPDDDAEGAALLAWQLAPEIDTYAFHAGLMYAHLGRKDEALQALHTVADNPRGRSLAPIARSWIDKINAGADDASLLAAMKADYPTPEGGLDEWTIATADVVQAVKDAADTEDAQAALSSADPQDPLAVTGSTFSR